VQSGEGGGESNDEQYPNDREQEPELNAIERDRRQHTGNHKQRSDKGDEKLMRIYTQDD